MNTPDDPAIASKIHRMILSPKVPTHPYVIDGPTVGQIHAGAGRLREIFRTMHLGDRPVCLATEDKAVIAAALLAALMGGPPLVLPYAITEQALSEAHAAMPFSAAVVGDAVTLPKGVAVVQEDACFSGGEISGEVSMPQSMQRPWVYLFTGGSTGAPKLWSKTPENLLGEAFFLKERFQVTDMDRIVSTAPPNHIYGLLYGVLLPLVASASVFKGTPSYPGEIGAMLKAVRATLFVSLPVHYRALKSHPVQSHGLRMAFSSAGALDPEDDASFHAATGAPITEVYGSTETGGVALRCRASGQVSLTPFSVLAWRIDQERLQIRSRFVSRELALDPEGFLTLPDRVETDDAGGFRILGRSDRVVKVGGKRVDLAQIQETLKRMPGVRDAYVFSVPTQEGGRENEIRAVVEGDVDPWRIRESIGHRLPPHAHPRQIKRVDRMPMTAAGKYDRERISKLDDNR